MIRYTFISASLFSSNHGLFYEDYLLRKNATELA